MVLNWAAMISFVKCIPFRIKIICELIIRIYDLHDILQILKTVSLLYDLRGHIFCVGVCYFIRYILASDFFSKKTINTILKLEISVVCRKFLAFKYIFLFFFRNKSDDYSYLYIRNLENSRPFITDTSVLHTTL